MRGTRTAVKPGQLHPCMLILYHKQPAQPLFTTLTPSRTPPGSISGCDRNVGGFLKVGKRGMHSAVSVVADLEWQTRRVWGFHDGKLSDFAVDVRL